MGFLKLAQEKLESFFFIGLYSELLACAHMSLGRAVTQGGRNLALPIWPLVAVEDQLSNFSQFSLRWHIGDGMNTEPS